MDRENLAVALREADMALAQAHWGGGRFAGSQLTDRQTEPRKNFGNGR